jgi:hypothetical protein
VRSFGLFFLRYGVAAILIATGIVVLVVVDEPGEAYTGAALFVGAGLSVLLMNVLFRIGMQGDKERDQEDEARAHFDKHGRWPDV